MDIKKVIETSNKTFKEKFATFSGRASTSEYWSCILFWSLIEYTLLTVPYIGWGLAIIWALIMFFPVLSLTVRRLHDRGKSGWWILVGLLFGNIVLLLMCYPEGDKEANAYGEPCD